MDYEFCVGEMVRIKGTSLTGIIDVRSPFFLINEYGQMIPDGKIYIINPIPKNKFFIGAKEEYLERVSSLTLEELTRSGNSQ